MANQRYTLVSAVHLILMDGAKILLLRRYNTGYEDGNYSVVAGHLDGNETVIEAMAREASEEAGLTIQPKDLEVVHVMHRYSVHPKGNSERIDFFLKATRWSGQPTIIEKDKCDDLSWFLPSELPSNVIPYIKEALDHIQRQEFFSVYGWDKQN